MRSKRGLSPVIATVLLILLTIAAVVIVAGIVIPFVRNNLSESTACLNYRDYFQFEEEIDGLRFNCYDSGNQGITVKASTVSESVSNEINGFELVFLKGENSERVSFVNNTLSTSLWKLGGSSGDVLKMPYSGEIITYVYDAGEKFDSVEIYPLLKSGDVCEVSDSVNIINCEGISLL